MSAKACPVCGSVMDMPCTDTYRTRRACPNDECPIGERWIEMDVLSRIVMAPEDCAIPDPVVVSEKVWNEMLRAALGAPTGCVLVNEVSLRNALGRITARAILRDDHEALEFKAAISAVEDVYKQFTASDIDVENLVVVSASELWALRDLATDAEGLTKAVRARQPIGYINSHDYGTTRVEKALARLRAVTKGTPK